MSSARRGFHDRRRRLHRDFTAPEVILFSQDVEQAATFCQRLGLTEIFRLTAAGVPALAAPSAWLGRLLIAWVQDPDGHPIRLVQRLAVDR